MQVIQRTPCVVFVVMQLTIQSLTPPICSPIARLIASGRRHRSRRHASQMPADSETKTDRMDCGRLISAIAMRQDRHAFAQLFEYFAPRIKAFMLRSGAGEANAEELAQETMLTVWKKAALFDPASSGAAAWIFTIARNLRIDAHRRDQRGGAVEPSGVELEFQIDEAPQPDAQLASAQSDERVRAALSQLSTDQLRVIELSFFEEKAHAEIAQMLDIPLGTVKSRLRLAMNRLRSLLSDLS
jgi:RNA polymerase sigma-70 factor, ECF subfamily